MASRHPLDAQGRVLPECDWPQDRPAPVEYELIRRFCNTCNRESGADRFTSPRGLDAWLASQNLQPVHATPAQLDTIISLREALRELAKANRRRHSAPTAQQTLLSIVADISFGLTEHHGELEIVPVSDEPTQFLIGKIALMVMRAQHRGRWTRFKACPHCSWVFYDRSKNQSGHWCSMTACGGRANVQAHRRRRAKGLAQPDE